MKEHWNIVSLSDFEESKAQGIIKRVPAVRKPKFTYGFPFARLPFGFEFGHCLRLAVTPMIVGSEKTTGILSYPFRNEFVVSADYPAGNVVLVHFGDGSTQQRFWIALVRSVSLPVRPEIRQCRIGKVLRVHRVKVNVNGVGHACFLGEERHSEKAKA
jgi:hypothetical protein